MNVKTEVDSPVAQNVLTPTRPSGPGQIETKIELPQEEVDAIIRQKRKAREPKACYPCHQRKVKCDRQLPCDSCIKRDHADLCSYERPSKRRQIAVGGNSSYLESDGHSRVNSPTYPTIPLPDAPLTPSGRQVTVPKEAWDRMCSELQSMEETISSMRIEMQGLYGSEKRGGGGNGVQRNDESRSDESEREGIHAESGQLGTVHLGSRSVLAYMMGLGRTKSSQDAARSVLETNILPNLGLDNETATYPFVDLWSTDASNHDINGLLKLLPDDRRCVEFFTFYRDVACTIYPVVYDKAKFDSQLQIMLQNRERSASVYMPPDSGPDRPWGVSLSWIGLLFAVLASGCQSSRLQVKERELTSQVYSKSADTGDRRMTTRMAVAMGLQGDYHRFSETERWQRGRVWWALAWQDSHFSMSYDRPSVTALHQPAIPYEPASVPGKRSYAESMFQIISLTLEIVKNRILTPRSTMPFTAIKKYRDEVSRIVSDAEPHIRDRNQCVVTNHHLERLALKLHCGYITSEICRPALKVTEHHTLSSSDPLTLQVRQDCIRGLQRTITAYLEINKICNLAARSWIGIQRAISAAFLLGTLEESHQDIQIMSLLRSLEAVMAERANLEETYFHTSDADLQRSPTSTTRHQPSQQTQQPAPAPRSIHKNPRQHHQHHPSSATTPTVRKTFDPSIIPNTTPQTNTQGVHWARSMAKSLQALSKLNAALGGAPHQPQPQQQYAPSQTLAAPPKSAGKDSIGGGGGGAGMTAAMGMATPVTPESSSSGGEWNYGNMVERAGEFIQAPLWD
ncbi:MAG: hypothetical protein Q9227_004717 [Pyrenula ochraceoflavens]